MVASWTRILVGVWLALLLAGCDETSEPDADDDDTTPSCADGDCDNDGWTVDDGDCDDLDDSVCPGAPDVCGDHDTDCDGETDPGDLDADGDGASLCDGDCDDEDPAVGPDDVTILCNGVDGDCFSGFERHVPEDHPTLQAAVDAASDGDVICVAPGVYDEAVTISVPRLSVLGEGGADVTIVDASLYAGTPTVSINGSNSGRVLLSGLTLRGSTTWQGIGLRAERTSVTLDHCVVRDNEPNAGGIFAIESAVEISNSQIVENAQFAIKIRDGDLTIDHSLVAGNGGVGLQLTSLQMHSSGTLDNVIIAGNRDGIVTGCDERTTEFEARNIAVVGNTMRGIDLGVRWVQIGYDLVPQCCGYESLWGSTVSGNGSFGMGTIGGGCLTQTYSNVFGNSGGDFSNFYDPTGTDGNLSVDPRFVDTDTPSPPDWDLRLEETSALVDAISGALDPDRSPADIGPFGGIAARSWDLDGDGFPARWQPGTYDPAAHHALGLDCDDRDPGIHPGATDLPDNDVDEDCDGHVDETEEDEDADGWPSTIDCDDHDATLNFDDDDGDGFATCDGDCDDGNLDAYPGAPELCNLLDDDCDGELGAGKADLDGDGWGICQGDCDDEDAARYPGAPELCNGLDDDCDGQLPQTELDADRDGWMACQGDCDDTDPAVYPGNGC